MGLDVDGDLFLKELLQTATRQFLLRFKRLVRIADGGNPDLASLGPPELLSEDFRCMDLYIDEFAPRLFVPRVPFHEKARVAVPAIDPAARVGVDAVVEDLGRVQDAFGLSFFDGEHAHSTTRIDGFKRDSKLTASEEAVTALNPPGRPSNGGPDISRVQKEMLHSGWSLS